MRKAYFCDELNKTLTCFHDGIFACCSGRKAPAYYRNYKGQKIDKNFIIQVKKQTLDLLTDENIDKTDCKGCFYLRERTAEDKLSPTFNMLHISNWTHCNCGCIYCARMIDSQGTITTKKRKSEYYDMLPLLKQLYKEGLLDKENLNVCIQGGDISVLKEFEPLMKELLKQDVCKVNVLSNNIVYQPIIKKLLKLNKISFMTSLDCANPELYYKLKRVDKFQECINNLRKYAKGLKDPPIIVKYIVVEHLNDNINEISQFIDLIYSLGINNVEFMIDNKWSLFTNLEEIPFPSHYWDLYTYFKKACEEKNMHFLIWKKVEQDLIKYASHNSM